MEVKPGYKQTEVGVIPEDWGINRIVYYWTILDCKHVTAKFVGNGIPIASICEVQSKFVDLSNANQTTEYFYNHLIEGGRKPQTGDLIFSRNATVGEVAQVVDTHPPFAMGQDVCIMKKKSPKYSTDYLQNIIKSPIIVKQLLDLMVGSTFKRVNVEQIKNLFIPWPPLPEQTVIATALSDVDALISGLDRLIEKKRAIKQAAMQELLTGKRRLPGFDSGKGYKQTEVGEIPEDWEVSYVGDNVDFSGGSQPARSTFIYQNKIGYIQLIQIRDYKTEKYKTYVPLMLAKKFCSKEDIMIGRYGPPNFQIFRGIDGAYNVALIKVIPSNKIERNYLFNFLKTEKLFKIMDLMAQRSAGQDGLDLPVLRAYPLPLPPLPEQTAIATVLSDMDAEISALETRRAKTISLKQGMMQELLTGRIRLV